MNKELLKNYSEVKKQIKELEVKADELQPLVLAELTSAGVDKVESEFGTFSITERNKWTYPDYVKSAEKKFKDEKKKAEENGDAKSEKVKGLTFTG